MTSASIHLNPDPVVTLAVQYLLRLGDTCLILGQRLGEWCGHGPVLEEDIALANVALDLVGQSRAVLTRAGELDGQGHDEDRLAFLREERDFRNLTIVELPNAIVSPGAKGRDFAITTVRNTMVAVFLELLWQRLVTSKDEELAAIAGKAVKEVRYHRQHAADWFIRLGDGTAESRERMQLAVNHLWPYAAECFEADDVDASAVATGLGPSWSELQTDWHDAMGSLAADATLVPPKPSAFRSHGKRGIHSEHMGYLLAEMQHLQRAYPGGVW